MEIGRSAFGVDHISKSMIRPTTGAPAYSKPITQMSRGELKALKRTVKHHRNARMQGRLAAPGQASRRESTQNTAEFTNDYLDNLNRVKEHRNAVRQGKITTDGYHPPRWAKGLSAHEEVPAMKAQRRASVNHKTRFNQRNTPEARAERWEKGYKSGNRKEYNNVKLGSWQKKMYTILPPTMVGSGAYAMGKDKDLVKKADNNKDVAARTAAGTVAGGTAGYLASSVGGYAAKKTLAHRRMKALEQPGPYRKTYADEWHKFKQKEGFKHLTDLKDNFARADVMSRYPKTLKDWRGQRALAFKNKKGPYTALIAGPAVVGGAMAYKKNKQPKA